jgi:hypothetical protein
MDLGPHVEDLHRALASAGRAGGEEAQQLLDRLAAPMESAIRLAMLNLLSAAADEITADLAPGSVELRLRGGVPQFVAAAPGRGEPDDTRSARLDPEHDASFAPPPDRGAPARISLRLSEQLKAAVDETAGSAGMSVNTWLVRVITNAVEADRRRRDAEHAPQFGQHYNGWSC